MIFALKQENIKDCKNILENIEVKPENIKSDISNYPNNFDNRMTFLKEEFNIIKTLPLNTKVNSTKNNSPPGKKMDTKEVLDEIEESKIIPSNDNLINFETDVDKKENKDINESKSDDSKSEDVTLLLPTEEKNNENEKTV